LAPTGSVAKVASASEPAGLRLLARDRTVGAERPGRPRERRRRSNPRRRIKHEPLDLAGVLRGVGRHQRGPPRPAQQVETRDAAAFENEIDDRGDIRDGGHAAHDRCVGVGCLVHLLRTCRSAVSPQVEQIDVVTARGDVVHPRQPVELEVERGVRGIGRTVHEQQRALGSERGQVGRALVAHVDFNAGFRRHHHLFHDHLRRLRPGLRRECRRESSGEQICRSHHVLPCGGLE